MTIAIVKRKRDKLFWSVTATGNISSIPAPNATIPASIVILKTRKTARNSGIAKNHRSFQSNLISVIKNIAITKHIKAALMSALPIVPMNSPG